MKNKILFSVAAINLLASVQILAAQNGENAANKGATTSNTTPKSS